MGLVDVINAVRSSDYPPGEPVEDLGEALWNFLRRHGDRRDPTRAEGYHPSGAHGFCPRLDALKRHFSRPEADYFPPDTLTRFHVGSAWHDWCQNQYFGPMGLLWGRWKATCCGRETEADGFLPEPCARCVPEGLRAAWHRAREADAAFGGFWRYIEPTLTLPDEGIIGHTDGWLKMTPWDPSVETELLEIKTINEKGFVRLRAPHDAHAFQANVYMGIAREMGDHVPSPERGHVAYFGKGDPPKPPRSFRVSYDPEPLAEWRRRIALHRQSESDSWRLTPGICKSRVDGPARWCMFSDLCFRDDIEEAVEKKIAEGGAR